jgi:uncharacterized lipoprotein YbaY
MTKRELYYLAVGAIGASALFALYTWHAHSGMSAPAASATDGESSAVAQPKPKVASVEDATTRLAARLAKDGGSREDWRLLGESYEFLGRKAEADAAFARAETVPATVAAPLAAAPAGARITGTVELSSKLNGRVSPGATLYIYARSAELHGMPLAVLRVATQGWPLAFTLDDSNAMQPSRTLSGAGWVTVGARISLSGNAIAQRGDLVGEVRNVSPRMGTPVHIVIDRSVGDEGSQP